MGIRSGAIGKSEKRIGNVAFVARIFRLETLKAGLFEAFFYIHLLSI